MTEAATRVSARVQQNKTGDTISISSASVNFKCVAEPYLLLASTYLVSTAWLCPDVVTILRWHLRVLKLTSRTCQVYPMPTYVVKYLGS